MKKLTIAVLCVLALTVTGTEVSSAQNILDSYNGDFEAGLAQWRFFEVPTSLGSTAEVVTTDVAHGTKAIKITWVAPGGGLGDRGFDNWDTNVPVNPGANYTASIQAKLIGATGLSLHVTIGFFDDTRTVLDQGVNAFALTGSYQTFTISRTAPANAALCWIAFRLKDANGAYAAGTLYLDNAQLLGQGVTPVPFAPRVMPVTLPSEDVPIASLNVTEAPYSAMADGSADATGAFQQAIDYAAIMGGGTIFVPAGRYRFDGTLLLKEKVMLRGDWQSPLQGGTGQGTILMVYGGKGSESGTPFLSLNRGSGIRNMTIWYPEQTGTPVAYPWTIMCNPDNAAGRGDNTAIINVTLVNPYQGISIGPGWNELHYLRNVYGTPLKTGIWLSQTTDIGRIINVHFAPQFWSASGLQSAPAEGTVKSWLQNNAEGIVMGRSDWEYMYDISLVGYKTGVRIFRYDNSGPAANGVIYGLHTEEGQVGIRLEMTNEYGFAITNSTINVSAGSDPACIETGNLFTTTTQFNTCTFGGSPKAAVRFDPTSTGRLTFQNCTFETWGSQADDPAIRCEKGSVAVLGSEFKLDRLQLNLGSGVSNAQILDNVYPGAPRVRTTGTGEVIVSQEPLDLQKLAVPGHTFAAEPRPVGNNLYVVTDYGALGDKTTDNSVAFQAALNAAGQGGGGTVYVPAGWFKITSHLTVPTGVELRGIWDVPHHTTSQGSVLLAYEGKGNANATPFISLEAGSGVRGLTVWYPEQALLASPYPYPWTVQVKGAGCWVKDVTLSNTYQGIDLATYPSQNHYVSYLGGGPLLTGISANCNGEGWVENVQFNPHYWLRSGGYPNSGLPTQSALVAYVQGHLDAFKFGACTKEHLFGNFVYAAYRGLFFANAGGVCNADVFLHGTDAGLYGVSVESPVGSTLNFINSQLVLVGGASRSYIYTGSQFGGTASFYNTLEWGEPTGLSADINGAGNVLLQQVNTLAAKFQVRGGTSSLQAISMVQGLSPQFDISSSIAKAAIFGCYNPTGFAMFNGGSNKVEADYNYTGKPVSAGVSTGWENGQTQNDWNNTLYTNTNVGPATGQTAPVCAAAVTDSGTVLAVTGSDLDPAASRVYFKTLKTNIPVFGSTVLSYRLLPKNDLGRFVHVDLLFTDGTRLSEMDPRAVDSSLWVGPHGTANMWDTLRCVVGEYATGKTIQTVLIGYDHAVESGDFAAWIDDLSILPSMTLPEPWKGDNIGTPAPSGFAVADNDMFFLQAAGIGLQYGGDSYFLLNQPFTGDLAVTGRLDRFDLVQGSAFAGITIRESTSPVARLVQVALSPQYGIQTSTRLQSNSAIQQTTHIAAPRTTPLWFRITKSGQRFLAYVSLDSSAWGAPLLDATVAMDSSVLAGAALSSAAAATPVAAEFSGMKVEKLVPASVEQCAGEGLPTEVKLLQNYPNPFNPTTLIRYGIPAVTNVELAVYNVMGQRVRTLVKENQPAGYYSVSWDAQNDLGQSVSSGIYFYRLSSVGKQLTAKMLLLR